MRNQIVVSTVAIAAALGIVGQAEHARAQGTITLYVNPAAPAGGDGSSARPFQRIQQGIDVARMTIPARPVTIQLVAGTYTEKNLVLDVDDLWILGLGMVSLDGDGIPTGDVVDMPVMTAATTDQEHIFVVTGNRVQVSNVSFVSPNATVGTTDSAIFADGRQSHSGPALSDLHIYQCRFEGYGAGVVTRLASGVIDTSYFVRNRSGVLAFAGIPGLITGFNVRAERNLDAGVAVASYVPSARFTPVIPTAELPDGMLSAEFYHSDLRYNGFMDLVGGGTASNPAGSGFVMSGSGPDDERTRQQVGFFIIRDSALAHNNGYGLSADFTVAGTPATQCVLNEQVATIQVFPLRNNYLSNGRNAALYTFKPALATVNRTDACLPTLATLQVNGDQGVPYDYFNPNGDCTNSSVQCLRFEVLGQRLAP